MDQSKLEIPSDYVNTVFEPLAYKLASGENPSAKEIDSFSRKPEYRQDFFVLLLDFNALHLFPKEFNTFEKAAESKMVNWLQYPTELDTIPDRIELMTKEVIRDSNKAFTYYVFKFKTEAPHWAAEDGWMVGCVGPYGQFDKPYSWVTGTFSRFNSIDSTSTMIEAKWCHENVYKRYEEENKY